MHEKIPKHHPNRDPLDFQERILLRHAELREDYVINRIMMDDDMDIDDFEEIMFHQRRRQAREDRMN